MSVEIDVTPTLRPAGISDDVFLFELFVFSRERELSPLPAAIRDIVARQQFESYGVATTTTYPKAENLIVEVPLAVDGLSMPAAAGRLLVDDNDERLLVIDMAIHPDHRNRGLGAALLQMMMEKCRRDGKILQGSVSPYNPARRLYARLGITERQAGHGYIGLEWRPR